MQIKKVTPGSKLTNGYNYGSKCPLCKRVFKVGEEVLWHKLSPGYREIDFVIHRMCMEGYLDRTPVLADAVLPTKITETVKQEQEFESLRERLLREHAGLAAPVKKRPAKKTPTRKAPRRARPLVAAPLQKGGK